MKKSMLLFTLVLLGLWSLGGAVLASSPVPEYGPGYGRYCQGGGPGYGYGCGQGRGKGYGSARERLPQSAPPNGNCQGGTCWVGQ